MNDEEIVEGIQLLAETEGVFTETAGGTTIAVLKKLVEVGKIDPSETTVAYITGNGLKTTEAVASAVGEPLTIDPQRLISTPPGSALSRCSAPLGTPLVIDAVYFD